MYLQWECFNSEKCKVKFRRHMPHSREKHLIFFPSGLDCSVQPLHVKPSSATQPLSQRSKAADLAQNSQVKAALKQVKKNYIHI